MTDRIKVMRWIRYGLLYAALPLLVIATFNTVHKVASGGPLPGSVLLWGGMAALYLLSHILRALRLALLSASAYGVSARTTALLHLYTAPISLVLPFKLGELYRLQQLSSLTRDPIGAVLIVLLDRLLDVAVLLPAFAILVLVSDVKVAEVILVTLPLLAILVAATIVSFAGPPALESLQRYMFLRHGRPRARLVLAGLVSARSVVSKCGNSLRMHLVPLLTLSVAIWTLELTVSWLFVKIFAIDDGPFAAAYNVFSRTMVGANTALTHASAFQPTVSTLGFIYLLAIWPFVAVWYIRHIKKTWAETPDRTPRTVASTKIHLPRFRHGVG